MTKLPRPPLDRLTGAALFLDLDGTLLDIADRPEGVRLEAGMAELLRALRRQLGGRLAVVSGRSLEQIDAILGPCAADIAVSASHGCEHRWEGVLARPDRPASLDTVIRQLHAFARDWPGVIVEDKSFGAALHYRMAPGAAEAADALALSLAEASGLYLQRGKMVAELRVAGGDKGAAVRTLMRQAPLAGSRPIFAGDDLTDEPAFIAAREMGGDAILIGEPRETAANYGLSSPPELRNWLREAAR